MRFLCAPCLALSCTFFFAQDPSSNQKVLARTGSEHEAGIPTTDVGHAPLLMQQASTPRELVDTPSAIQQTTCIEKNGKPCPKWLEKLIGQYPPIDVSTWILFTAAHAGMWASTVVAVRNYRTSKEEGHSEFPAVAFMTGFDLLAFKTLSPAISVGPPVYAMIHYSRATARK